MHEPTRQRTELLGDMVTVQPDGVDVEALLGDLEGAARDERAELISWLLAHGFDTDQIRSAYSPMLLPANRVIGEDGSVVSVREVSESTGVNLELLQQLHRAVGLVRVDDPDAPCQSRADAESVLSAARLVDLGFDAGQVVLTVRLLMEGLSGAAMAMRQAALQALLRPGARELDLAQACEELARTAEPLFGPMASDLMRLALRHSFETEAINAVERAAGTLPGAREVGIAFADLVGFTRLGEQLPPEDLGLIAGRFADLARDVVTSPVQFVKTIGDAVMLVCADPLKLLTTALDLVQAAAAAGFPRLRVGLATGPAVCRSGDWYGSPVNLASRVTDAAPAGTVRVTESARAAIGDAAGIVWAFAEIRQLKGIGGDVVLYEARRSG
nr:adenylate/guanylate cyclase domain-containing protein [Mycolicibacter senuensis]